MIEWDHLDLEDQLPWLSKARYLIDRGYLPDQDEERLAKMMYERRGNPYETGSDP